LEGIGSAVAALASGIKEGELLKHDPELIPFLA
jgi:hypothetical protein